MTPDIRICFIGDSFVNGTGDETALGWAGRLCAAAHEQGFPVTYYNLGIRRNTSADMLRRWEIECSLRLPEGGDNRAVFSCGVNDTVIENGKVRISLEEARENIRQILCGAKKKYKVLMVSPPPVPDAEQNRGIRKLSQAFAQEAAAFEVPYIDLFSILESDADYMKEALKNDGFHPGSQGYQRMAAVISSSSHWWFHATLR